MHTHKNMHKYSSPDNLEVCEPAQVLHGPGEKHKKWMQNRKINTIDRVMISAALSNHVFIIHQPTRKRCWMRRKILEGESRPFSWLLMVCSLMQSWSGAMINIHAKLDWCTVPLQKSTMVYPGLASSVTMATKLFSCCLFLTARIFDIFPAKEHK